MSKRDLARIFLKRKTSWPSGQAAVPVDQARNHALRESFGESVLDKSLERVESYWQAQVFSGKGTPPKGLSSDAEVIEYVRRWPGAVGYVSSNASTDGVNVIRITD
jgi:ABC-type phosphate transport system substrate-binding protein